MLRDDLREPDDGEYFGAPDAGFPLSMGFDHHPKSRNRLAVSSLPILPVVLALGWRAILIRVEVPKAGGHSGGPEVGCLHSICGQPPHGCCLVLQRGWTYMVFRSRKHRAARTALRPPLHTGHRIGGSPIRISRGGHG